MPTRTRAAGRQTVLLLLACVAVALAVAPTAGAVSASPRLALAGLRGVVADGQVTAPEYALVRATAVFRPGLVHEAYGPVAVDPRSATLAMRDLALQRARLAGPERVLADALLARPAHRYAPAARPDNGIFGLPPSGDDANYDPSIGPSGNYWYGCLPPQKVCVYWATATKDSVPLSDANANLVPDYAEAVAATLQTVVGMEVGTMGYRAPKDDSAAQNHGVDGSLDVYVVDLPLGLYGYCAPDDPKLDLPSPPSLDVAGYCVFDNDYLASEFGPAHTPLENLQVTVAHEFFHAIQYAYNVEEDPWLMEGSAAWVEDEVFDDVNDDYQYVASSQVVAPYVPLDVFWPTNDRFSTFVYGSFTFFKLLGETKTPDIVRQIWEAADGAPGKPAAHSLIAVPAALGANGLDFASFYNFYIAAAWWPPSFYDEGAGWLDSNGQQLSSPFPRPAKLTAAHPATALRTMRLVHLTGGYATFVPGKGLGPRTKLVLTVDLSRGGPGARLSVITATRAGDLRWIRVNAKAPRTASVTVPGFGKLRYVALVLSNGSTRVTDCHSATDYPVFACNGVPVDDNVAIRYRATAR